MVDRELTHKTRLDFLKFVSIAPKGSYEDVLAQVRAYRDKVGQRRFDALRLSFLGLVED